MFHLFFGISYALNDKILLKFETDTTRLDQKIPFKNKNPSKRISTAVEYKYNDNLTFAISNERDDYFSFKFIYKRNATKDTGNYDYEKQDINTDNRFDLLIRGLEGNGIGVDQIFETSDFIGLRVTQFQYNNGDDIEDIIMSAKKDSGIKKPFKTDYSIAGLDAYTEIDEDLRVDDSQLIYERLEQRNLNSSTRLTFRPFLAAREGFFKYSILAQNDIEYIIRDNLFFSSNLKYSIKDNFDDLTVPPRDTYPAQVRSDVKEYLRSFEDRIIIGRAQLDYHLTPRKIII